MIKNITFSLTISLLVMVAYGQKQTIQITKQYQNESLESVLEALQEEYSIKFFYKSSWLSGINVNANIVNKPIEEALAIILRFADLNAEKLHDNIFILLKSGQSQSVNYSVTVQGKVVDGNSGETVPNAFVRLPEVNIATVTDINGEYSFDVQAGTYLITVKSLNSDQSSTVRQLYENQEVELQVFEKVIELDDVVITGRSSDENLTNTSPGKVTFNIESIRKLPNLLGETDLSRIILSLPGVQTVGEGATGFNVRGGSIDQNLILMDNVPIYNSSHLLGFFSIFNPDLINNFSVYKGNIPVQYGGRLSSVVSVEMKKPQHDKFRLSAGLGPISNKATFNIPLIKNKFSIVVGGRYSNPTWILKSIDDPDISKSSANFYDFNFKANLVLGQKDALTFSLYNSDDFYDFGSDTSFSYKSSSYAITWNHEFNKMLYASLDAYISDYNASLIDDTNLRQFEFNNGIAANGVKLNIDYQPSERHNYKFGTELKKTTYDLGTIAPNAEESSIESKNYGGKDAIEIGLFGENNFKINNRLTLNSGIRFSQFFLKESEQFVFSENQAKSDFTIIDTLNSLSYRNYYTNIEPRFSLGWRASDFESVKVSYTRSVQYEQLFSNSTASLPTDLWIPVSNNLEPAVSDQYSIGYFRNISDNKWETSIEFYYKNFQNINLLKTGAEVLSNETIEADIVPAIGESFGAEFLVRKLVGNITGWLSYFYSQTDFLTQNQFKEEQINNGRKFRADFDRPHNLNISLNYKLSRLWSMSGSFVYNTGRPVTVPTSSYVLGDIRIFNVDERNNFRTPDNHRLDLSFTLEGSNKKNTRWANSFTFSLYNLYGRRNPFSIVTIAVNNTMPRTYQLSVLGNVIPSFTYNLKFE